jgi:hypothetical protein
LRRTGFSKPAQIGKSEDAMTAFERLPETLRLKITENPEVAIGDTLALNFRCLRVDTAAPISIQVEMPANPAAALLEMLLELRRRGILPEITGETEFRRPR